MNPFKFLPQHQHLNLKVISIEGPEWNGFTGYLAYARSLEETYDYVKGDELDIELLEVIQKSFPNSILSENCRIMLEGELDEGLENLRYGTIKTYTIVFIPQIDIPYEELRFHIGRSFTGYRMDFKMRLQINETNESYKYIPDSGICYINHEKLDNLITTISPL